VSVPPDMMARLGQQQAGGNQLPGGGAPGPAAAPMAEPQKKDGKEEKAALHVHIAMNMLEQALGAFGSESKQGKVILATLTKLGATFGENDTSDLMPAEIKSMVGAMPQMGGGSEQQQKIMQMMKGNQPAQMPQQPAPMPQPMQGA
jgi:hypothetical protein